MFHSRTLNAKINHIHERALRIVYTDHVSSFIELLEKDNSVTIHVRNLQKLATEMFKINNELAPLPIQNLFNRRLHQHDLRSERTWDIPNIRTVKYGSETLNYMGPKIWDMVPPEIKMSETLLQFKRRIKTWIPPNCICRICKTFIPELGFL